MSVRAADGLPSRIDLFEALSVFIVTNKQKLNDSNNSNVACTTNWHSDYKARHLNLILL